MSGEKTNYREAMDALVKRQVDHGVPVEKARAKAREVAIRNDRRADRRNS